MSDFKAQFKAAKAVRGSGSSAKLVSRWLSWHDIALTTLAAYYLSTYASYVTICVSYAVERANSGVEGAASSCRGQGSRRGSQTESYTGECFPTSINTTN